MPEHGSCCVNGLWGVWERAALTPRSVKQLQPLQALEKPDINLEAFYECIWRNCRKYNCL